MIVEFGVEVVGGLECVGGVVEESIVGFFEWLVVW